MSSNEKIIVGMWGTTNLCLYLLDKVSGAVLDKRTGPGVSKMKERSYSDVLYALIDEWLPSANTDRIYLGGMVGSSIGWRETNYIPCPANLSSILHQTNTLQCKSKRVYIVPGLSCTNNLGEPDVLRGEEIELLAVAEGLSGVNYVCIPGTHTKWVKLKDNIVESFFTCVAGEVYDVLLSNGVLVSSDKNTQSSDLKHYENSLQDIYKAPEALLALMFSARSRTVTGSLTAHQAQDRLSGLLIGSDVHHALKQMELKEDKTIHIIGNDTLSKRYEIALKMKGIQSLVTPASTACATGLWKVACNHELSESNA